MLSSATRLSQCQGSCWPERPLCLHQIYRQLVLRLQRIPEHHHGVLSRGKLRPACSGSSSPMSIANRSHGIPQKLSCLHVAEAVLEPLQQLHRWGFRPRPNRAGRHSDQQMRFSGGEAKHACRSPH